MKSRLLATLGEIVNLLVKCGYEEKATWLKQERFTLQSLHPDSREFLERLTRLKEILFGMGSLSDLPLYPKPGSKWNIDQVRAKQWDLVDKLGQLIDDRLSKK